ncbi:zinc finger MYM-type protein 1-like protein [Tanacetum coccineum]
MVVCEAFKKYGLKGSGGWNIRRQKMLHIVYHVIFSIRIPLDELVLIGLPSKGSTSGKCKWWQRLCFHHSCRGSDERPVSKNQGNLLELVKLIASYNKDVENVMHGKAP